MRDVLVTGLPCSGTTVTARVAAAAFPALTVDHVVVPHGWHLTPDGAIPHWKPLPEADLVLKVWRHADPHRASWSKHGLPGDLRDEALERLRNVGPAWLVTYEQFVATDGQAVVDLIADELDVEPRPHGVDIWDGNARYLGAAV